MEGFTLIQAICILEANGETKVTMIQYEDGSGYKFNYTLNNSINKFADLTPSTYVEKVRASVIKSIIVKL
jgi:hypothetical protein